MPIPRRNRMNRWMAVVACVLACGCATETSVSPPRPAGTPSPNVVVVLWFDTEDYLLLSDDDATLRLATFLTSEGIRATFKIVGEKARVLEKRGRTDVIA